MTQDFPSQDLLQQSIELFKKPCTFIKSVPSLKDLPESDHIEVALAGRSNVGKSSLMNALFDHSGLARVSNTPGRTQHLNFFDLDQRLYVVDMPGYGYAKAPKPIVLSWNKLLRSYLQGRPNLKRVFLLIDARHGVLKTDLEMMKLLDDTAVTYQVVLTKSDKLSALKVESLKIKLEESLKTHAAAYPTVIITSSEKKHGFEFLRAVITDLLS